MASLSLCMIVKDESTVLKRCLDLVKGEVDEIIIVDTGSTDDTKEIAKKFTDKIYDFNWVDDFSKARNFSLSKASKEWILILDADEILAKEDLLEIKGLIDKDNYDAIELIQRNYTNNSTKSGWRAVKIPDKFTKNYSGYGYNPIIRVIKNNLGLAYEGVVHEILNPSIRKKMLKFSHTEIPIHHYYEEKPLEKRQLEYLALAEKAVRLKPHGRYYGIIASVNLHFKKDYKTAVENFKKAIEYNYKIEESKEGLAQAYIGLKDYSSAYEIYKNLIKESHKSAAMCNNVANILVIYKKYEEAIKFLKLALKLGNPNRERIIKNILILEKKVNKPSNK